MPRAASVLSLLAVVALVLGTAACASRASGATGATDTSATDTSAAEQLDFGVKMARRGLWGEALFRFRQADRLAPGNPRVRNNIAVAYEALGQFDEALSVYQEALRADPANPELKRNYTRFVEFYRNFKPAGDGAASAADEETR